MSGTTQRGPTLHHATVSSPRPAHADKSRENEAVVAARRHGVSVFRASAADEWQEMATGVKYYLKHGGGEAWVIAYDAYALVNAVLLGKMYEEDGEVTWTQEYEWAFGVHHPMAHLHGGLHTDVGTFPGGVAGRGRLFSFYPFDAFVVDPMLRIVSFFSKLVRILRSHRPCTVNGRETTPPHGSDEDVGPRITLRRENLRRTRWGRRRGGDST